MKADRATFAWIAQEKGIAEAVRPQSETFEAALTDAPFCRYGRKNDARLEGY